MNENRLTIWNEYTGEKPDRVRHNFVDYDRYHEARLIEAELRNRGARLEDMVVIDYGCCAGDYGIHFARLGAHTICYDIDKVAIRFVKYRFKRENLPLFTNEAPADLAIFGEVLEHCDNPLEILSKYSESAEYIFTSSYPYRSDDPADSYWNGRDHSPKAREQQPACRELLNRLYNAVELGGEKRLWIRK